MNRTTRLARQPGSAAPDPQAVDTYVEFEETLANATLALAQGLEQRGNARCEFLYDAEKVMRKTIERLRPAEFAPASQHQGESLTLLVKAREALRVAFGNSPPSEATRRFDREQAQKLRKPKGQNEQAELLADKLRHLAEEEAFVYATLGGLPCEQGNPTNLTAQAQRAANARRVSQPSSRSPEGQAKSAQESNPDQKDATPQPSDSSGQTGKEGRGDAETRRHGDGQERGGQERGDQERAESSVARRDLEQRQREIVLDAYETEKMMGALGDMTELARSRMRRGTEDAEKASDALARGDVNAARESAGQAGDRFQELARHVAGLTARDLADKIGAARDQAADLAERQRGLASRLDQESAPGGPASGSPRENGQGVSSQDRPSQAPSGQIGQAAGRQVSGTALAAGMADKPLDQEPGASARPLTDLSNDAKAGDREGNSGDIQGTRDGVARGRGGPKAASGQDDSGAGRGTRTGARTARGEGQTSEYADSPARLAERGRTLLDLLDALARNAEADRELTGKIATARGQAQVETLVQQMEVLRQRLGGQPLAEITTDVRESADRLEVLAQELEALHGTLVAPRLNELIAFEKQTVGLRERLGKLASGTQISQWHLDAQQLLQTLEKAQSGGAAVDALRRAMTAAGWGTSRTRWGWASARDPVGGHQYYVAPGVYTDNLTLLIEDLQREARELLLRDLLAAGQEAVPPQYERLVERYFEVLSQEKKRE